MLHTLQHLNGISEGRPDRFYTHPFFCCIKNCFVFLSIVVFVLALSRHDKLQTTRQKVDIS